MRLEEAFGQVLRQLRNENNLSQEKLSRLCKLDRTYISMLERGKRQPTLSTLFAISDALNVTPALVIEIVTDLVGTPELEIY